MSVSDMENGSRQVVHDLTEEFLAGMNLLSSYDFIEQSCEYIVKQLSRMQKQGECPEECRQAVASLMFAAARFSDLPELRDLRDIFQERYGNCLEVFVNQKFVEKLSSRSPATEKRLQVLQDVASEFSIKWDSRGFERRMATPSVDAQVDVQKADIVKQRPGLLDEKNRIRNCREGNFLKRDDSDNHISGRKETIEYREKSLLKREESSSRGDNDISLRGRHALTENKHSYPIEKGDTKLKVERSSSSSIGKMLDNVHFGHMRPSHGISNPKKGEIPEALFRDKAEFDPNCAKHLGKTENVIFSYNYPNQNSNSIRKGPEQESDKLKSCSSYTLPPPYVKSKDNIARPPYIKPIEDKYRDGRGSKHAGSDMDGHSLDTSPCNRSNEVNNSGRPGSEPDHHHDLDKQFVATAKVKNYGHEKELDYQDAKISLPKPRSIRRKHHKPSSSHNVEDVGAVNRSRRKDHSRNGLHILFDEEKHHRRDDDERIIDKLLIHYSKKPSSYDDAGKLRQKLPHHRKIIDNGESSLGDGKCEAFPHPARSVSLPHDQIALPESKKVITRSNTFQPDNQARHVHPKLPDYDDLAARFAALKGR
ncbi:hypothetical protein BUALT_Bualt09G0018400 [Buddleja alternifolia]|uniref:Uncharacterized protein n=1 Tax=Buddleja alternifolia TaxID=168488 RepID=A0AAV6X7C6_9LAMI|nr:hypothetical protein BUALT_Bualt09G0018400 [Buddleja alternifolia]